MWTRIESPAAVVMWNGESVAPTHTFRNERGAIVHARPMHGLIYDLFTAEGTLAHGSYASELAELLPALSPATAEDVEFMREGCRRWAEFRQAVEALPALPQDEADAALEQGFAAALEES